jgi:alcohol dehydrogenase, propanol-preferring
MRVQELIQPGPVGAAGPLHLAERAPLVPGHEEIAIDVTACGICRTDLQLVEGDLEPRKLPVVPGHQVVGRVRTVGAGVTRWAPGDRVGVGWLAGTCGGCTACRSGLENLCPHAAFTGWDRDGGYAEQMLARADFAYALPDSFADLDAAPLLCGGVIGYRSLRISGIEPGGRLGLYGFGASALLSIQVARYWGCEVYVCTRSEPEQARALQLGAVWAGGAHDHPPVPLDAAVTFAPVGSVAVAALEALRPGGTVAINAIHLDHVPEFDYRKLWQERSLRSVANFTRRDAHEFLALAAEIPIRTVVDLAPLDAANSTLRRLRDGELDGAAVLTIEPDPRSSA